MKTDTSADVGISKVSLSVDGVFLRRADSKAPYEFDVGPLSVGVHELLLKNDAKDKTSATEMITITVE